MYSYGDTIDASQISVDGLSRLNKKDTKWLKFLLKKNTFTKSAISVI